MLVTISSFPLSWSRSLRLINGGRGPVCGGRASVVSGGADRPGEQLRDVDDFEGVLGLAGGFLGADGVARSEEHTSELQSPYDLVCSLLLEKKNKKIKTNLYNKKKKKK